MKGILGRKLGMTQVFATDGTLIPVTVVEATPNVVLQKKTVETDGYCAIQVGFEDKREKTSKRHGLRLGNSQKFSRYFKSRNNYQIQMETRHNFYINLAQIINKVMTYNFYPYTKKSALRHF